MKKEIKAMDYRFIVYPLETTDGVQWCVEYPDVPAVVGGGLTKKEAIKDAEENLNVFLEYLIKNGMPLPMASKVDDQYSGKVTLRMSKSLHKKATELSEKEGISLNSFINEALNEKIQNTINNYACEELIDMNARTINDIIYKATCYSNDYQVNNSPSTTNNLKFWDFINERLA